MTATENTYKNCFSLLEELYKENKIGSESYLRLDRSMKDLFTAGYNQGAEDTKKYANLF